MRGVEIIKVTPDEEGMRLDRWFKHHFPSLGHGALEKMLRKGNIRVDGGRVKANRRLQADEEVRIPPMHDAAASKSRLMTPRREDVNAIKAITIYEDDAFLALNKPFGLAVQGGAKTSRHVDGMLAAVSSATEPFRLVHRLDKDTGGLLLIAKTRKAAASLAAAFKSHSVKKTYWALTAGAPQPYEGTIDAPVAKRLMRMGGGDQERMAIERTQQAQKAMTHYQTLDRAGPVAFLAMRPVTGRTHQLRVHAAAIDCPIVGDGKYGGDAAMIEGLAQKLHLFCKEMSFPHPVTRKAMTLKAPLSGHMKESWAFFSFDASAVCEWPEHLSE